MSSTGDRGLPTFGEDYDLERWSDGSKDEEGNLIWHHTLPGNSQDAWDEVRIVTLNFDPNGEGDYRNYRISPDRPLDPWGRARTADTYDLDDLALQAFISYGFEF